MNVKIFFSADLVQLETDVNAFINSKISGGGVANPTQIFKYTQGGVDGLVATVIYQDPVIPEN